MPTYTVVSIGTGVKGTGGTLSPTAGSRAVGDLCLLIAATRNASNALDVTPANYTALTTAGTGSVVYGRIATNDASDDDSLSFTSTDRSVAQIIVLRSSTGWPAIGSVLADTPSAGASTVTGVRYRSHTISVNDLLAVQIARKNMSNAVVNPATAVAVTAGFTAAGFMANNDNASGVLLSMQVQGQTTATSLAQNDEAVTGNSESLTSAGISFTLAGVTVSAPAFTVPATVTSQTSTAYTIGFTPDSSCTIYGVAVIAGSAAPSVAQVKAGQNGAGDRKSVV